MNIPNLYCNFCMCQIPYVDGQYHGVGYGLERGYNGYIHISTDPDEIPKSRVHFCDSCNLKFEALFNSASESVHDKLDTIMERVSHIVPLVPRE